MNEIKFYPMSEKPVAEESDVSFSKTVIVYGEKLNAVGLGYYDFEIKEWLHFSDNIFLLKCWCYLPNPGVALKGADWETVAPKGYKKHYLQD